jgi:hypothetical protein
MTSEVKCVLDRTSGHCCILFSVKIVRLRFEGHPHTHQKYFSRIYIRRWCSVFYELSSCTGCSPQLFCAPLMGGMDLELLALLAIFKLPVPHRGDVFTK